MCVCTQEQNLDLGEQMVGAAVCDEMECIDVCTNAPLVLLCIQGIFEHRKQMTALDET